MRHTQLLFPVVRTHMKHYGRSLALLFTIFCLGGIVATPATAGGYVDGKVVLSPSKAISTGAVSITPTFNNDQFNDKVLVGAVNNDRLRTPSTADPVSTVTGNNYHDETDFVIRGRNGLNYVFTRTYNSAPSATNVDQGPVYGIMGRGWTHSYLMRLKSNDFGECPNCTSTQKPENGNSKTSSITYTDERGGEQNYLVNETNFTVAAPKGVYDTLTLDSPVVGQHTLAFRNGVKYIFETPTGTLKSTPNVVARLKFIDNAWGDRLTLAYDTNGRLSTIKDNLGIASRTGLVFTYDTAGHLNDATDWTGRKWIFLVDGNTNLQYKVNPLFEQTRYSYTDLSSRNLLTEIGQPAPSPVTGEFLLTTRFQYYQNGRTFKQSNSFNVGDTLDYDLYRKTTRVTDARGGVREYFYDDNGRMTKLIEPDGAVLMFENQGDLIRSKKYDALGYATTYSYRADKAFAGTSDQFGNVTREQDALGRNVDTTYGPLDQVASVTDKRGTTSTTTFGATTSGCDYLSRPKESRISVLNGSTNVLMASQCWNANATLNSSRSYLDAARYVETRLTYEAASNGLNVSQVQTVGMPSGLTVTQTYTYDSLGRKKTETLKRRTSPPNAALIDLTTSYDYDALDRVTKTTDSLGNEAINYYASNGRRLLLTVAHRYKKTDGTYDVRAVVTRSYDDADRPITQTDAEGNTRTTTYDDAGNPIAVTDAEGHTTRFEYDAMNRRVAVVDATGYRTETTLTLRGDVVGIKNANGEQVTFEVDALGRKTAAIDARGFRSEFTYDQNGNLTCTVDANSQAALQPKNSLGCTESRTYDELGRVKTITDALNGQTSFTYNLAGQRLTVTDAENKLWQFSYDDLGRVSSETDHSAKTISYKTDEAGNVYEKTNRLNEITRYTFDSGQRNTRVDYLKDSTAETFGYDAAGNRNAAANAVVGYTFGYDRLNRLTTKLDSRGKNMAFTFDKVGNILTKTTYQGSTTSYVYNAANRLVMLRNPDYTQVDYQYDPAGRLLSRVTAAGARASYLYDANGWLTKLTQYDAANTLISDTTTTRDRVGNILSQATTGGAAPGTSSYTLDALYRLSTADYPGTTNDELFTYDKVGNRKTYTKGSLTANASTRYYNYTAGSNRLAEVRIGSTSGTLESGFTNDFEGRLTNQTGTGAKTLTWDAKGRVKTVGAEGYQYDPMDYRIGRTGGAIGNRDYYLEGEHLESEYSGGTLQAKYFRGTNTDELVAGFMLDTDSKLKPYLFHQDGVTSTTAVSGHNGGAIQQTTYSAFGQTQASTGSSPNRQKYTGREDDNTGLYYYRARYYDPAIGRFLSEDPMGFGAGDVNFYQYTSNNPVNANDPSGNAGKLSAISDALRAVIKKLEPGPFAKNGVELSGPGRQPASVQRAVNNEGAVSGCHLCGDSTPGTTSGNWIIDHMPPSGLAKPGEAQLGFPSCATCYPIQGGYVKAAKASVAAAGIAGAGNAEASNGGGFGISWSDVKNFASGVKDLAVDVLTDPSTYYAPLMLLTPSSTGGCSNGVCSDMVDWSSRGSMSFSGSANGGFLLYPNKANTNMMQSVYSK